MLDACDKIKEQSNNILGKLKDAESSLKTPLNNLKNKAKDTVTENISLSEAQSEISDVQDTVNSSMNSLIDGVSEYTGTCLDPITDKINSLVNTTSNDIIGEYLDELQSSMSNLVSLIDKIEILHLNLNFEKLLYNLDELLGCLSSSCFGVEIQDIIDESNRIVTDLGLSSDGSFSYKEWLLNNVDTMTSNVIDIVEDVKNSTVNIVEEVKTKANQNKSKIPNDLF